MQKLIAFPILSLAIALSAGCSQKEAPIITEAFFCDLESKRRFTQEEIDWRAANAPWNLRKDFKTNLAYERECETGET